MIDVTVVRGAGNIPGEDITNTLILSEAVAIQRGRKEIDSNAKITPVTLDARYRSGLETGLVIQVLDALQGVTWRGKITGVDISVEGPVVTTTLEVERV